jgi:ABC-2 type transport system ATP-binding protein
MKQRLCLASAILGNPEMLILDEPANGLDPAGIAWLRGFIRARAQAGATVLVSSHQLAELEEIVDDVIIIHKGAVVASGPVEEVTGGQRLEEAFLRLTGGDLS